MNKQVRPEKVVIPQFVAEWIEGCKADSHGIMVALSKLNFKNHPKVSSWFRLSDDNALIFARAWLDGYEVEREKLYTVELPNGQPLVGDEVLFFSQDLAAYPATLTEAEICKGFAWAWQAGFAKEVEGLG